MTNINIIIMKYINSNGNIIININNDIINNNDNY